VGGSIPFFNGEFNLVEYFHLKHFCITGMAGAGRLPWPQQMMKRHQW
jgi:hypothetical protein